MPARKHKQTEPEAGNSTFPVVAIGASAGGLEAVVSLFEHLPPDPGMAFVVIIHHDRRDISALAEVLGRATSLPVTTIGKDDPVERDHVYIPPPGAEISISERRLSADISGKVVDGLQVDNFFRALARDQGSHAIGIVLSGSASDGTLGVTAIKEGGGITFAQDDSARFASMPEHAVAAGSVDFVLAPPAIASELINIGRNPYLTETSEELIKLPEEELLMVFDLLKKSHDVDFTHYKPATVERRIRRRMAMQKVDQIEDYIGIARHDPVELERLFADILIRVTGFFRDPAVFETLRQQIVPQILREREVDNPVRVWVPGCATGEEVYSLAIAFLEAAGESGSRCPIQIFGTDVSEVAVERARQGFYPADISLDVGQERLRQFFTKVDGGFRISKSVRDICVFARQNVTKDPPFSRLDLISCRNLMIYLGAVLQRKVMSIFHYALRPKGLLVLGSSESIGGYGELFGVVDRRYKIYEKRGTMKALPVTFDPPSPVSQEPRNPAPPEAAPPVATNLFRDADRVLLGRYSPPGVLINDLMEVIQFRGRTSRFLEPAPGQASFNVLKMAREGLLADLRAAIHGARKVHGPVRREGIRVKSEQGAIIVNVEVLPFLTGTQERYQLVLFEEVAPEPARRRKGPAAAEDSQETVRLRRELDATREYLQSIIEEQEAMNEELRSANEEIQSSNEELQSTNEELETAKEELQSSNEELTTLNEELESRNEELADANNDLTNLLASVDVPIVILDRSLRIRRANAGAQRTLNIIPTDVGRPLHDLNISLVTDGLEQAVVDVIDRLETRELAVTDRSGREFSLRVRPYKTTENRIEGAILVLLEKG